MLDKKIIVYIIILSLSLHLKCSKIVKNLVEINVLINFEQKCIPRGVETIFSKMCQSRKNKPG
jgi:hypothetical protein